MSQIPKGNRAEILLRADGRCERCERSVGNYPADIHHRRPRGMGGSKDETLHNPEACVLLCRDCHSDIHANPTHAVEQGWLVPRRDPRNPADVPVYIVGTWYLVTAEALIPYDELDPPF